MNAQDFAPTLKAVPAPEGCSITQIARDLTAPIYALTVYGATDDETFQGYLVALEQAASGKATITWAQPREAYRTGDQIHEAHATVNLEQQQAPAATTEPGSAAASPVPSEQIAPEQEQQPYFPTQEAQTYAPADWNQPIPAPPPAEEQAPAEEQYAPTQVAHPGTDSADPPVQEQPAAQPPTVPQSPVQEVTPVSEPGREPTEAEQYAGPSSDALYYHPDQEQPSHPQWPNPPAAGSDG